MTEALPLRPLFFQPGAGGVPGTTQLPYRRAPTSVEFTMTDQFGFESCTVVYAGTVEDALFWLGKLGAAIRIYGPDSDVVWEGVLNAAEVQVGDERHQRVEAAALRHGLQDQRQLLVLLAGHEQVPLLEHLPREGLPVALVADLDAHLREDEGQRLLDRGDLTAELR